MKVFSGIQQTQKYFLRDIIFVLLRVKNHNYYNNYSYFNYYCNNYNYFNYHYNKFSTKKK